MLNIRRGYKIKSYQCLLLLIALFFGCNKNDIYDASENSSNLPDPKGKAIDFRQEMRYFIASIGTYARSYDGDFIIIPQNGQELVTDTGEGNGIPQTAYLNAIDATGRESMFYGYLDDNDETPSEDNQHLLDLCLLCEQYRVDVMVIDYCSTRSKTINSYKNSFLNGFISFAAPDRELRVIPDFPSPIYNENDDDITRVSQARNFLVLLNSEKFASKKDFIHAVVSTNYDLIIIDLFHNETAYIPTEISQLKIKHNGGKRLVVCYMSIGEAEDYRYYWQESWKTDKPDWLEQENPDWKGNYKVKYWKKEWQKIIFGNDDSYLKKILDSGFDGAYLDIIDAFEYFEDQS